MNDLIRRLGGTRGLEINPEESVLLSIPAEGETAQALRYTEVKIKLEITGGTIPDNQQVVIEFEPLKLDEPGQLEVIGHNKYTNSRFAEGLVNSISLRLKKAMTFIPGAIFHVTINQKEK